jgi:Asp-tRNA(Asn)/Glu-tRNA(Gln) amidotransferase A subunit family amidase
LSAFFSRLDALMMPVAPSPAPRDLTTTGDGAFCAPASLIGLPALSLPSGLSQDRMPLAIQLLGPAFQEPQLLSVARWCESVLGVKLSPPQPD